MTEQIKSLFETNLELIEWTDKAILYIREQNYAKALEYMPKMSEAMRNVVDVIIGNKEYFELSSEDFLAEMLEGILEAGKARDYVLLADLLELQLLVMLCNVQELIMKKEDFAAFSEERYQTQCERMKQSIDENGGGDTEKLFETSLDPEQLLEEGYRVEFTSCGLMTVAVGTPEGSVYLHTNNRVSQEAFMLARSWVNEVVPTYLIRGFGMGYHVAELAELVPEARIEVYETNASVLKLACAFAPIKKILDNRNIHLYYCNDESMWEKRIGQASPLEKICIHAPSVRK